MLDLGLRRLYAVGAFPSIASDNSAVVWICLVAARRSSRGTLGVMSVSVLLRLRGDYPGNRTLALGRNHPVVIHQLAEPDRRPRTESAEFRVRPCRHSLTPATEWLAARIGIRISPTHRCILFTDPRRSPCSQLVTSDSAHSYRPRLGRH